MKKEKKEKSKKKLWILLILIGIIIIVGIISAILFYKSKELKVILNNNLRVNINEKKYNTDFIKTVKNGKIITKKKKIKTDKLGTQKVLLEIENYFHKKEKYSYEIKIIDKEKPIITHPERFETESGSEINLLEGVVVTDNSKEEITVTVEGTYDFNNPSTYELEYIAKDSSENEAREKFTLEVKEKKQVYTENYVAPNREFTTSKGFKGIVRDGITYIDGIMIANKTYPLPASYNPGGITGETNAAYEEMVKAAWPEGVELWIASGYRSYYYQRNLYNNYVSQDGKEEADTYSARPGHSEHQTGLAFDLNQVDRNFGNTKEGKWLAANAWKYGFILRYPEGKTNETGYIYESWHFRYVGKELAAKLYNGGDWITLESYFGITSEYTY